MPLAKETQELHTYVKIHQKALISTLEIVSVQYVNIKTTNGVTLQQRVVKVGTEYQPKRSKINLQFIFKSYKSNN